MKYGNPSLMESECVERTKYNAHTKGMKDWKYKHTL